MDIKKYIQITGWMNGSPGISKLDYGTGDLMFATCSNPNRCLNLSQVAKMFASHQTGIKLANGLPEYLQIDRDFHVVPTKKTIKRYQDVAHLSDFEQYYNTTAGLRHFSEEENMDHAKLMLILHIGEEKTVNNIQGAADSIGITTDGTTSIHYFMKNQLKAAGLITQDGTKNSYRFSLTPSGEQLRRKALDSLI